MKSSCAIGESLSGSPLREDIRVRRPAAVHGVAGAFGHRLQGLAAVSDAFAAIQLLVPLSDRGLPCGYGRVVRVWMKTIGFRPCFSPRISSRTWTGLAAVVRPTMFHRNP